MTACTVDCSTSGRSDLTVPRWTDSDQVLTGPWDVAKLNGAVPAVSELGDQFVIRFESFFPMKSVDRSIQQCGP